MTRHLVDSVATTDALSDLFSDSSVLRAMLSIEASLARVQGRAGVIPASAAEAIASAASAEDVDVSALAAGARQSGTPIVELVRLLADRVASSDRAHAAYVHLGATSQDISDTALVLLLKQARAILDADHQRLERALRQLSDRHSGTLMLGRTLLQPALPITFGLKAAGWAASVIRSWRRVSVACGEGLVLQFGGPAGTLASFGDTGPKLAEALATELELPLPDAPWHTHRDRLAALVAALGIYVASLGKMARDISLLMQDEVAEAAEPGGGSSSMPYKRNPASCAIALAASVRVPGLVASFLSGMVQEHERAVGGWHAEWPTVVGVVEATGAALSAMVGAVEGMTIDSERMRANLDSATVPDGLGAAEEFRQKLLRG